MIRIIIILMIIFRYKKDHLITFRSVNKQEKKRIRKIYRLVELAVLAVCREKI